jgi:hypothetical protein
MKYRHYAPKSAVNVCDISDAISLLNRLYCNYLSGKKTMIIGLASDFSSLKSNTISLQISQEDKQNMLFELEKSFELQSDLDEYANQLFFLFRKSDQQGCDEVMCIKPEEKGIGSSILSRLSKAAAK